MTFNSPRAARRMLAVFLACAALVASSLGSGQDEQAPPVQRTSMTATGARRVVLTNAWLGTRTSEIVSRIDASCYEAALARRATSSGELVVRATVSRLGRLTGVTATRSRGGTLSTTLASCVRTLFARTTLDFTPLPRPPEPRGVPSQTVSGEQDPPAQATFPIRIEMRIAFTAPPPQQAEPAPTPTPTPTPNPPNACRGSNPQGCRSTGCPGGMRCDTQSACVPSSCGCNPETGAYICTMDCGGGRCVPNR